MTSCAQPLFNLSTLPKQLAYESSSLSSLFLYMPVSALVSTTANMPDKFLLWYGLDAEYLHSSCFNNVLATDVRYLL